MQNSTTDILEGLPLTEKGIRYMYILVVSHYYFKWTKSFTMENMEAETVAKIKVKQFIVSLGVLCVIHFDQSSQFESRSLT